MSKLVQNLVPKAVALTKSHEAELFRVGSMWAHLNLTPGQMLIEYKVATATGEYPEWFTDFALDVLAGRVPIQLDVGEGLQWVIRPLSALPSCDKWRTGKVEEWSES